MLKEAVGHELVDRHQPLDVLQIVEPTTIVDLIQGANGNEIGRRKRHGDDPPAA
jgi:hypothetical protein